MAMPMISREGCGGGGGGHYSPPSSFRHMLKSSICCFTPVGHHPHEILDPEGDDDYTDKPAVRSSCDLEIREMCRRGFAGRRSGGGRNRRRYRSEDFRYDPASYSLNFEDEAHREDELALSGFAARLPATPDRYSVAESWKGSKAPSAAEGGRRREVTVWS
ncbi:unnamed protein product [Linum tenue]|uniref:Uncharacterized protein n=1 Tax=Linum tenue TaxID=586396 RepID=A0AAV0K514_9ROSI|nr:unnamed protein product [Linum tenue]